MIATAKAKTPWAPTARLFDFPDEKLPLWPRASAAGGVELRRPCVPSHGQLRFGPTRGGSRVKETPVKPDIAVGDLSGWHVVVKLYT